MGCGMRYRLFAVVGVVALMACGSPTAAPTVNVGPTQTRAAEVAQLAALQATANAPTATPKPTNTPPPPTATNTPLPPTATPILPTATTIPLTSTPTIVQPTLGQTVADKNGLCQVTLPYVMTETKSGSDTYATNDGTIFIYVISAPLSLALQPLADVVKQSLLNEMTSYQQTNETTSPTMIRTDFTATSSGSNIRGTLYHKTTASAQCTTGFFMHIPATYAYEPAVQLLIGSVAAASGVSTTSPTIIPTSTGNIVQVRGYSVTVHAVDDPAKTKSYVKPAAGARYVSVDVTLTNTGTTTMPYNSVNAKLHTADNREYLAKYGGPDPELSYGDLYPGESERAYISYEVTSASPPALFIYDPFGGPKASVPLR